MERLVSLLFSSPTTVIGAVFLFLVLYFVSVGSISGDGRKEPPGPRALPLLGNLLQLDLNRPYRTLCDVSFTQNNTFWTRFHSLFHLSSFFNSFSFPRPMDLCLRFTLDPRRWWSSPATRPSKRHWSATQRSLESEIFHLYLKI